MRFSIIFAGILMAMLVFAGCAQTSQQPAGGPASGGNVAVPQNNTNGAGGNAAVNKTPEPTGEGMIVDAGNTTEGGGNAASGVKAATSQQDCATLTPTCGACVAKPGCGWCKTSSTCFYGDANGPKNDATCQKADWSVTEQGCQAPVGGTSCSSKTNCADCLTGSNCMWCQEGTKCSGIQSSETCASGGWRTKGYQCYGGS